MNILETAQSLVHGARQKDYGHPIDDFGRTARMWSAYLGFPVSASQVAICMALVKVSRLANSPDHMDSLVDLAGYAATYEMVRDETHRRETAMQTFGPLEPVTGHWVAVAMGGGDDIKAR